MQIYSILASVRKHFWINFAQLFWRLCICACRAPACEWSPHRRRCRPSASRSYCAAWLCGNPCVLYGARCALFPSILRVFWRPAQLRRLAQLLWRPAQRLLVSTSTVISIGRNLSILPHVKPLLYQLLVPNRRSLAPSSCWTPIEFSPQLTFTYYCSSDIFSV